jgi:hypothetical protein
MTSNPAPSHAAPGMDEIALSAVESGQLCFSRAHRTAGIPAAMLVTFGQLGTRFRDALWYDSWGLSYPMCLACWDVTRHTAVSARPGLVIQDTRPAPAAPAAER